MDRCRHDFERLGRASQGSAIPNVWSDDAARKVSQWWAAWRTMRNASIESTDGSAVGSDDAGEMRRVEALLFLAREPLTTRRIAYFADLADGTRARSLIRGLNREFDAAGRAFRIEEVGGGFQLLTRPCHAGWLRRLFGTRPEARLTPSALETLTVVAYRQPVSRADVEAIRGVQCGELLRQLMNADLIRIAGRSEELGRPFLYGTTRRFLQSFGLRRLEDLPRPRSMERENPITAPQPRHPD
jgi:segregation and condensation protein B